jgi:hypothetical protein
MLHGNGWRMRRHLWTRCRDVSRLWRMDGCLRMLHANDWRMRRIRAGRLGRMGRSRRVLDRSRGLGACCCGLWRCRHGA